MTSDFPWSVERPGQFPLTGLVLAGAANVGGVKRGGDHAVVQVGGAPHESGVAPAVERVQPFLLLRRDAASGRFEFGEQELAGARMKQHKIRESRFGAARIVGVVAEPPPEAGDFSHRLQELLLGQNGTSGGSTGLTRPLR